MCTGLLLAALCAAAPLQANPPQNLDQPLMKLQKGGISLEYEELDREEAELLLDNLGDARTFFMDGLGLPFPGTPTVTVRFRLQSRRSYFTDGKRDIQLWYGAPGHIRPIYTGDERIYAVALPVYAQLWLCQSVTSQAGLDPRILDSLIDYLVYAKNYLQNAGEAPPPQGLGRVWYQIDELYEPGTVSFLLNSLGAQRMPGHEVGPFLRRMLVQATEDEQSERLLDAICAPLPLFGRTDLEPSEALALSSTIRLSRVELFNGCRILDQIGDPISLGDRIRDFDLIFDLLLRSYPDPEIWKSPPRVNGVDLSHLYFEFRPRVLQSVDNVDFYLVLRDFLSRLEDRSLTLLSAQGAANWRGVTGMTLQAVGDQVLVSSVTPDAAPAKAGLRPGMEVVTIDDRPVQEVWSTLDAFLRSSGSCSSATESRARSFNMLLTGAEDAEARLGLIDRAGGEDVNVNVSLTRGAPNRIPPSPQLVELSQREDGIAVLKIKTFTGSGVAQFLAGLQKAREDGARALIVDLRGNEGGALKNSLDALGTLIGRPLEFANVLLRKPGTRPGDVDSRTLLVEPLPDQAPFDHPVAVLVDDWTADSAELFALGFRFAKRGPIVGRRTIGSVNQRVDPLQDWQTLPATGVTVSYTGAALVLLDGSRLQGLGVQPDLAVEPNLDDVEAGRDPVLERAAAELLKAGG